MAEKTGPQKQREAMLANKRFKDAIQIAVMRPVNGKSGRTHLERIADKLVRLAGAGDMNAIREVGDRLDGKAKQEMDVHGVLEVHIDREDSSL